MYHYYSYNKIIIITSRNYIYLIYISSLKEVINRQEQIILMVNKKHNFNLGIVFSVTILSAIFFASISASAFSQSNSTDSSNSTTALPGGINTTSTSNSITNATAGTDTNSSSTGSK
jgi:hypothetical protein